MTVFNKRYGIVKKYIPDGSKRRSCEPIDKVVFIVAHDTGNRGSTAMQNVNYYCRTCNNQDNEPNFDCASAHIFVDDKAIIECVPALTGPAEKAQHVRRIVDADNKLYGCDANKAAIGVEYCYGPDINADEAYKRYIWVMAYLCFVFDLNVECSICGHFLLDPLRRHDPVNALSYSQRTYDQLLRDIIHEYNICINPKQYNIIPEFGEKITTVRLNIRKGLPETTADIVTTVPPGTTLFHTGYVTDGLSVNGIAKWYVNKDGNFFWGGGVR